MSVGQLTRRGNGRGGRGGRDKRQGAEVTGEHDDADEDGFDEMEDDDGSDERRAHGIGNDAKQRLRTDLVASMQESIATVVGSQFGRFKRCFAGMLTEYDVPIRQEFKTQ